METRQMIEGQLIESGQEPMNVQVVIEEYESGSEFVLLMTCPEFFLSQELILHLHKEESDGSGAMTHKEPEEGESADGSCVLRLEEALADSKACNKRLEA